MSITLRAPRAPASRSLLLAGLGILLTTGLAGCATTSGGDLPIGEWSGRGTFIYEDWAPGGPAAQGDPPTTAAAGETISREYDTTLSLRKEKLGQLDIIRMDIRSTRGELPNLEDETHLIVALVPDKRVGASVRLYRAVAAQLNPKPDEPLEPSDDAPPFAATAMTHGNVTTFRIWYSENFMDALRFEGSKVEKTGLLFNEKRGLVHWSERLMQKR